MKKMNGLHVIQTSDADESLGYGRAVAVNFALVNAACDQFFRRRGLNHDYGRDYNFVPPARGMRGRSGRRKK